jgi:hypothetical protein
MNKIKYLLVTCLVIALSGCSDFLDLSPLSNANENGFYKSEDDFKTALTSAYSCLYTLYGPESLPSLYGELSSDNVYSDNTAGTVKDYEAFDTHVGMDATNTLVEGWWNSYYESIFKINNILDKMDGMDFTSKAQLQGEARFLRALLYFDMTRAWGDVPLVLKTMSLSEAYAQGRTPQADVYKAIVEDLTFAAQNLPAKSSERFAGAATADAANVLLGKVYLTMGDKTSAASVLLKEYGKFSLVPYADLWSMDHKNCSESIFEIQYLRGKSNPYSLYWAMFTPLDNRIVTAWGGGFNQCSDALYNSYEEGDARRDLSIQNGFTNASGVFIPTKFTIKWRDTDADLNGLREASGNNFIVLRYADVLLMLTEATGDVKYMNQVRARVNLPGYGETGYPSDKYPTVQLALQHEQQVEFAFEFHRWFDLQRLGTAVSVLNSSWKATNITDKNLLLPIPQTVIDQNPNVITQNEAYK